MLFAVIVTFITEEIKPAVCVTAPVSEVNAVGEPETLPVRLRSPVAEMSTAPQATACDTVRPKLPST